MRFQAEVILPVNFTTSSQNCDDLIMKTNFDGDDKNISLNGDDKNIRTNKRYTGEDLQIILFLDFGGCCRLYPSWDQT